MRYALARRRARRRLLERAHRRKLIRYLERQIARQLNQAIGRRVDPVELRERTWCGLLGIDYSKIVPGTMHLGTSRVIVQLAEPLAYVQIRADIAV